MRVAPFFYSKPTTPLNLSASVTLAAGQRAVPDTRALENPFRGSALIDAVTFTVSKIGNQNSDYSGMVLCRFRVGHVELSPTDIPISLFTTSLQSYPAVELAVGPTTPFVQVSVCRRWKLPVPLLVPPGAALVPSFFRPIDSSGVDVTVDVSYAGRYLDSSEPLPDKIQVPYVNAFYPPPEGWFNGDSLNTFYLSGPRTLANLLDVPVRVQRFIGRVYDITDTFPFLGNVVESSANTSTSLFSVLMKDSYGREIVKDSVGFGALFDVIRRSWTFSKILGPREHYLMNIYNTPGFNPPQPNRIPMVSIIGIREENFR